jgi:hypothetical protein
VRGNHPEAICGSGVVDADLRFMGAVAIECGDPIITGAKHSTVPRESQPNPTNTPVEPQLPPLCCSRRETNPVRQSCVVARFIWCQGSSRRGRTTARADDRRSTTKRRMGRCCDGQQ